MKTMKVTYKTELGATYRTFAPVITIEGVYAYMHEHYSNVTVLSARPSVKSGYKKYHNRKFSNRLVNVQ
jgi:hypothetical protein